MAFQIDEKHLSKLAQEHMHNAKSKAKLTRDAIEYYVQREEDFKEFKKLKDDIAEIKSMLKALTSASGGSLQEIIHTVEEPEPEKKAEEVAIPSCYE